MKSEDLLLLSAFCGCLNGVLSTNVQTLIPKKKIKNPLFPADITQCFLKSAVLKNELKGPACYALCANTPFCRLACVKAGNECHMFSAFVSENFDQTGSGSDAFDFCLSLWDDPNDIVVHGTPKPVLGDHSTAVLGTTAQMAMDGFYCQTYQTGCFVVLSNPSTKYWTMDMMTPVSVATVRVAIEWGVNSQNMKFYLGNSSDYTSNVLWGTNTVELPDYSVVTLTRSLPLFSGRYFTVKYVSPVYGFAICEIQIFI